MLNKKLMIIKIISFFIWFYVVKINIEITLLIMYTIIEEKIKN